MCFTSTNIFRYKKDVRNVDFSLIVLRKEICYDVTLRLKISRLSNLKLQFNQIIFSNGYDLIEVLIQHIVSLEHLSLSIGYLSEPSVIDGRCIEYDYWLLKRKEKIICYIDIYENDFYLYSLLCIFRDIDCISNVLSMFKDVKCLKFYMSNCRLSNKSPSVVLKNVNTIICKYLTSYEQLFKQHFSLMLPNVCILKIDNVSIYRIMEKQLAFDHNDNIFSNELLNCILYRLEVTDIDDEKKNYFVEFLRYFFNIKILALQFANKIRIRIIQSILKVLLSNKRCLLSFIQCYTCNNNFVITDNVAEIFKRLLTEHFGIDNCYIHIERYYLKFGR
ncbi:unnamed protein product [Didymodactylos carnosus]|uniref:Uncharacterized protein n=1 Tax=Didymodactylos carnosus TaxID=1234261 RepID=A0A815ILE5_9BILA|nr:unnamed protein product [Didymodactylos carnosus]CAF4250697.1 unnamed protein product [Didymodactylos carnosus]